MPEKPASKRRSSSTNKRTTAPKRPAKKAPPARNTVVPQNLQREIFAVLLLALGLLTLLFSAVGTDQGVGLIGARWNAAVQNAFGSGKVLVPVALGILGTLMLFQEHFKDTRLTAANIIGTIMVLVALLMLLDFPGHDERYLQREFHVGEGGGVVGSLLLHLLITLIGKAGALLLTITAGLIGIMLTFNLTVRQILSMTLFYTRGLRKLGAQLLGPPLPDGDAPVDELDYVPPPRPPLAGRRQRELPPPPPANPEDFVLTPIAERPAPASMYAARNGPEPSGGKSRRGKKSNEPAPPMAPTRPLAVHEAPTKQIPLTEQLAKAAPAELEEPLIDVEEAHRAWPLPPLTLLDAFTEGQITDEEKREKARIIEETLASFKVEARVVEANTGPAVTQFALQPAIGVKISKITSLTDDLALALAAPSLRIEAPVPGRSVVGIEIPNSAIALVAMRDVMESDEFENNRRARLKIPLGKDVSGTPVVADMTKMPHLLVAGSTGSGKSICINSIIISLLLKHTPNELKFIMVDPKMVELIVYNNIPHLLTPVVTELERVVSSLKWAVREMERRYKVFAKGGFRNLESYMTASRKRADLEPMPYIVVIIDELADLMMLAPDEVETLICRLAQMARATGIHLLIATQRPSVDVVTGLIKANFPSRIAFAVTSQIDSRVIMDSPGAEQLLGRGDMLYLAADAPKPVRVQGTYVSDGEVERVVRFWRSQVPPDISPYGATEKRGSDGSKPAAVGGANAAPSTTMGDVFLQSDEQDELLPKAIELVQKHQRASASMLQRRLRIGYTKAAQLIELMEQQGVVGPAEGGRSREVLRPEA